MTQQFTARFIPKENKCPQNDTHENKRSTFIHNRQKTRNNSNVHQQRNR